MGWYQTQSHLPNRWPGEKAEMKPEGKYEALFWHAAVIFRYKEWFLMATYNYFVLLPIHLRRSALSSTLLCMFLPGERKKSYKHSQFHRVQWFAIEIQCKIMVSIPQYIPVHLFLGETNIYYICILIKDFRYVCFQTLYHNAWFPVCGPKEIELLGYLNCQ